MPGPSDRCPPAKTQLNRHAIPRPLGPPPPVKLMGVALACRWVSLFRSLVLSTRLAKPYAKMPGSRKPLEAIGERASAAHRDDTLKRLFSARHAEQTIRHSEKTVSHTEETMQIFLSQHVPASYCAKTSIPSSQTQTCHLVTPRLSISQSVSARLVFCFSHDQASNQHISILRPKPLKVPCLESP